MKRALPIEASMGLDDERGLIVSWLVKLLIAFAVVAVVVFDAGSIAINFFTLDSAADDIAIAVSTEISSRDYSIQELRLQAKQLAKEEGARLAAFDIDREGTVHVRLRRRAGTLLVGRIGPIKDWARATANARSAPTS